MATVGQKSELSMVQRRTKLWLGLIGGLLVPFILMAGYAMLNHFFYPRSMNAEILGISVCISGGLVCVWLLPVRAFWRCLISIAYIPACIYPLAVFQLLFASIALGERF